MPDIDACKNLVFSHHILLVPTSASGVRAEQSRFHRVKARDQYSTMPTEVSDANVSSHWSAEDEFVCTHRANAIKGRCDGLCVARSACSEIAGMPSRCNSLAWCDLRMTPCFQIVGCYVHLLSLTVQEVSQKCPLCDTCTPGESGGVVMVGACIRPCFRVT